MAKRGSNKRIIVDSTWKSDNTSFNANPTSSFQLTDAHLKKMGFITDLTVTEALKRIRTNDAYNEISQENGTIWMPRRIIYAADNEDLRRLEEKVCGKDTLLMNLKDSMTLESALNDWNKKTAAEKKKFTHIMLMVCFDPVDTTGDLHFNAVLLRLGKRSQPDKMFLFEPHRMSNLRDAKEAVVKIFTGIADRFSLTEISRIAGIQTTQPLCWAYTLGFMATVLGTSHLSQIRSRKTVPATRHVSITWKR